MDEKSNTLIAQITAVQGSLFTAVLEKGEEGVAAAVTLGDEDILIGRLGSYVRIHQGELNIVAMVSRMVEREHLSASMSIPGDESLKEPITIRTIELVPIGSINASGQFERGISVYPTTGAEVHAIPSSELDKMFEKYVDKGYDVGYISTNPTSRLHLDPSPMFGRHSAILGQTGAGKSWTVASLVQKAIKEMPKAHIILLDLHGEYKKAFNIDSARVTDATTLEIPYWIMTFAELIDLFVDRSEDSAPNQIAFFRDTLNTLRAKEKENCELSRTTVDTPVYFSLDSLKTEIENKNKEKDYSSSSTGRQGALFGRFDRFLIRLDSRINDNRYDFLLKPKSRNNSMSLEPLLRDFVGLGSDKVPLTIIDLSPVPFDVRPTVTAQIGRLAFEFNYWNPQYREFPILLICEEAHAYINRGSDSQYEGARKSMERIAKEGRKYGVGLMVVSQRPHELSETVLSQCGTFVCLRITNPDDQEYVRKLVPEAERDLVNILAGLRRGEALVLGEATPMPSRVQFDRPDPTPNSDDVDFYKYWKEGPDDLDVSAIVDRWRKQER